MKLELDEIFTVIDKVNSAELDSFAYRDADIRLSIKRKGGGTGAQRPLRAEPEIRTRMEEQPPESKGAADGPAERTVSCPMVGTFYAAPAEDQAPFVTVGDMVKKGQIVGIVEAMKLMNEIESECDGIVEEILVENGQLVEYGQPLMRLREA